MTNNELMTMENRPDLRADLTTATVEYCSFNPQSMEEKKQLFTAMNNPDKRLDECVNMTILVKDVYAERLQFVSDDGEIVDGVRIVLIDVDGNSYGCCAGGVFNALKKMIRVFGEPTWTDGIPVIPYTIASKRITNGKVLTLKLA